MEFLWERLQKLTAWTPLYKDILGWTVVPGNSNCAAMTYVHVQIGCNLKITFLLHHMCQ